MKNNYKKIILLLVACALICALVACNDATPTHVCNDKCSVCNKCTSSCTDPACADKCQGHTQGHSCGHVCETCGGCTSECADPVCADNRCTCSPVDEHVCQHKCTVDGCGKCTDPDCTDPVCAEKCQGHKPAHTCNDKCPTCGLCTSDCDDPACADKCPGHTTVAHTCKHICPECGKCLDETCTDTVCADKCQGHDFAGELKLDLNSSTAKIINAQINYTGSGSDKKLIGLIDGDTTHFRIDKSNQYYNEFADGLLKARYCAVNTPESTGTLEPWGKKASDFNKSKLRNAVSIVVESNGETWNYDSTGSRYMVWIWYKTDADSDYRNLNLELLQEGLAVASNIGTDGEYSAICWRALNYARAKGLYVHGTEKDPDFYYGNDVTPITLKALRADIALNGAENSVYQGKTIAIECTIAYVDGASFYVEAYDEETGLYFGLPVFAGYNFKGTSLIERGNRIRLVGKVTYSENYGWQMSDLKYYVTPKPGKIACKLLESNVESSYQQISGTQFNGTVQMTVITGTDEDGNDVEEEKTFTLAELINGATISMDGLTVTSIYTTTSTTDSNGAMTLTCTTADGQTVKVRTARLYDDDGNVITEDAYKGKTINVRGIVDYYNGTYQIAVNEAAKITVVE